MTREEIKKGAPNGANGYNIDEYFPVDYWRKDNGKWYLWDGEKWSLYPYQHHNSLGLISPLP